MPQIDADRFAEVMAYLGTGVGKAPTKDQIKVYYDLLNDLPLEALQFAARQAMAEQTYPVIPPVGVLRKLATEYKRGGEGMTAGEAYELARRAIRRFGYYAQAEGLASLPPDVAAVTRQIGWDIWCDNEDPTPLRARFIEFWETRQRRDQRVELLPENMQQALAANRKAIENAGIGKMPVEPPRRAIECKPIFKAPEPEAPKVPATPEQAAERDRFAEAVAAKRKLIAESQA